MIRDPMAVGGIKQRLSLKYGPKKMRKRYPTSEVALEISL